MRHSVSDSSHGSGSLLRIWYVDSDFELILFGLQMLINSVRFLFPYFSPRLYSYYPQHTSLFLCTFHASQLLFYLYFPECVYTLLPRCPPESLLVTGQYQKAREGESEERGQEEWREMKELCRVKKIEE